MRSTDLRQYKQNLKRQTQAYWVYQALDKATQGMQAANGLAMSCSEINKAKEVEILPLIPTPSVRYNQSIRGIHMGLGEHDRELVWGRDCIFTIAWSKLNKNWQGALIPHMPSTQLIPSLWSQKRMCRILSPLLPDRRGSFPWIQGLKLIWSIPVLITN